MCDSISDQHRNGRLAKTAPNPEAKVRSIIAGYYENDPNKGLGYLFRDEPDLLNHQCFDELVEILNHFNDVITGKTLLPFAKTTVLEKPSKTSHKFSKKRR